MRSPKLGGVVFLPLDRQVPPSLKEIDKKLRTNGHPGMVFPQSGTDHAFGWDLETNGRFCGKVLIAVFHPNEMPQFSEDHSLGWYVAAGHVPRNRHPARSEIERLAVLAQDQANERMMMGVVGITQLVAGGAGVFLFSGGLIGSDENTGSLGRIREQLAKVGIRERQHFFAFENTDGTEMLSDFDWDRFLREWPKVTLADCVRVDANFPETLLALDILLQGYLTVRSEQAPWHKIREELSLGPHSNTFVRAYVDTATTNLFRNTDAPSRSYWFDPLLEDITDLPFSSNLDFRLERGPAAELPTLAKKKFERCLLSAHSLSAAEELAGVLSVSPNAAEAVKTIAKHDGGALRLAYELARRQGQAFGWKAVATSCTAEDRCSSILLALFVKAHQELIECYQAMQGAIPEHWSVEGGQ